MQRLRDLIDKVPKAYVQKFAQALRAAAKHSGAVQRLRALIGKAPKAYVQKLAQVLRAAAEHGGGVQRSPASICNAPKAYLDFRSQRWRVAANHKEDAQLLRQNQVRQSHRGQPKRVFGKESTQRPSLAAVSSSLAARVARGAISEACALSQWYWWCSAEWERLAHRFALAQSGTLPRTYQLAPDVFGQAIEWQTLSRAVLEVVQREPQSLGSLARSWELQRLQGQGEALWARGAMFWRLAENHLAYV
uniref:Uncharacterized protein n=1 Tax=Zooxanthella nutricula TaxID=1333877 RepID=A0A7S2KB03_9DINO